MCVLNLPIPCWCCREQTIGLVKLTPEKLTAALDHLMMPARSAVEHEEAVEASFR